MSDTANGVLSLGASAAYLTLGGVLAASVMTFIAARRGSSDVRATSRDNMFLTRLTGVEDDFREIQELLEKERKEHADIVADFKNAELECKSSVRNLEFQITVLQAAVHEEMEDFLKCKKNVVYLAGQLTKLGVSIDLVNYGVPPKNEAEA